MTVSHSTKAKRRYNRKVLSIVSQLEIIRLSDRLTQNNYTEAFGVWHRLSGHIPQRRSIGWAEE